MIARTLCLLTTWIVPWDPPKDAPEGFDEVGVFALALSTAPSLVTPSPDLLARGLEERRPGVRLIAVVVNDVFEDGAIKELKSIQALSRLLWKPSREAAHVDELVRACEPFDGLEIDYERVPPWLWEKFTVFLEDLGRALHARGKTLFVDLEPPRFYKPDMARRFGPRVAAAVDGVRVMAYYEKGGLSLSPGPGNSVEFLVRTARWAEGFIPRDKLTIVVSVAGTDWTPALPGPASPWRGHRIHYSKVRELMELGRAKVERQMPDDSPHFQTTTDGKRHEIWFEDEQSLRAKAAALQAAGILKIGFWYWGASHPDIRSVVPDRR